MNAVVSNTMDGKDYKKGIDLAIERFLESAGIAVEGQAVALANFNKGYQSGRTKGSITYATNKKRSYSDTPGDEVSAPTDPYTVHIGTNVEYAQHLEYGTVKMAKQPFLRRAFDEQRGNIMREAGKDIKWGLKDGSK